MPDRKYETPQILSDAPLRDKDRAHFHFDEFAVTLARLIASRETRTPLAIGVSGPWGSGKTTLLKRVQKMLDEPVDPEKDEHKFANPVELREGSFRPCKTVWFDAWKYADEDELLVALVRVILNTMQRGGIMDKLKAAWEDPTQPEYDVLAAFIHAFQFKFGGLSFHLDPKKHEAKSPFESHTAFFDYFDEAFERLLARWVHGTGDYRKIDERDGALVVFIDDLDRCLPSKAVQVLEAVKLFLDKSGCVFVLGADTRVVREAVARFYRDTGVTGEKAGDYLEKIIQLRFELPPIQVETMGDYLAEAHELDAALRDYWEVLVAGAEINPRKVKTFLNDLNLAWAMLVNSRQAEGVDRADFTRWQVLMRAAPENFRRRVQEIDDLDLRLKFVLDALRWVKGEGDETLEATFQDYAASRRLRRVLGAIESFGEGFNAHTLDAFLHLTAPPPIEEIDKIPRRGVSVEGVEDVEVMRGRDAPTRAGTREYAGIEFVPVPAGKFLMGSREDEQMASDNEHPQHSVDLPNEYWFGRAPVTNAQFKAFTDASGHVTTAENEGGWNPKSAGFEKGFNWRTPLGPDSSIGDKPDHPVVQVSWDDAQAYCRWLNESHAGDLPEGYAYRLPSEAEWEKAARGEYGNRWPWGDEWDASSCNTQEGGRGGTSPVGEYSPAGDSPYGAADMAGNVWEWTHSLHEPYPYQPDDGREDEDAAGVRVLRGGSFKDARRNARAAARGRGNPDDRAHSGGLRVVVAPISPDF